MNNAKDINWNEMIEKVHHQWAVPCGWWTDIKTNLPLERSWKEACLLVVSEIIEAMEGLRKNLMDDKLPHRPMVEVELADTIIRLCDMAGGFGFEINPSVARNLSIRNSKTDHLMDMVSWANLLCAGFELDRPWNASNLISIIFSFCEKYDYDIVGALEEKHEFNKHRADHKLENRKKANGKAF